LVDAGSPGWGTEMTTLGKVHTELGPIELCHEAGVFTTVGEYVGVDGATRETVVVQSHESALEWWRYCEQHGVVFGEMPEE